MSDFPQMLYKAGGPHEIHGGKFDYTIVNDEAELEQAQADGWHLTTPEAKEAADAAKSGSVSGTADDSDNAPPTRAELEQKATELGVKFDGRTSDKKLGEMIAVALKG